MAKIAQRIVNSYNAYLNYRAKWSDKGYGLDRELTLNEYADAHRSYKHKHPETQHIARELAGFDRTFTRQEASGIIRRLRTALNYEDENIDKFELWALNVKYKTSKSIYSLELSTDEMRDMENRRRQYWIDRGKEPKYTIQASARQYLFNSLRDAGLSYKEADSILYG